MTYLLTKRKKQTQTIWFLKTKTKQKKKKRLLMEKQQNEKCFGLSPWEG